MMRDNNNCFIERLSAEASAKMDQAFCRRTSNVERRTRKSSAFTLIELLVVMTIMALMIGLALPALKSLGSANAVSKGSAQLANTLTLARAKAIGERSHTRVVFSDGGLTNTASINSMTSYAALLWTNQTADIWQNWGYISKWQQLPLGAYIVTTAINPSQRTQNVPFTNGVQCASPGFLYVEFKSTGALASSPDMDIPTQEGTVRNGSLVSINSANTLTNHIYWITGKAKVLH